MSALIQQTMLTALTKHKSELEVGIRKVDETISLKTDLLQTRTLELIERSTMHEKDFSIIKDNIQS